MTNVTCAISGIPFTCTHFNNLKLQHTIGYFHPIFAVPYKNLLTNYTMHCKGQLTPSESYLLFLALLNATDSIIWKHPVTLSPKDPQTISLVERTIAQLVSVIERTNEIKHPSFKQPKFKITLQTSKLTNIKNYITQWNENISYFYQTKATIKEKEKLQAVENRLSYLILSGEDPKLYASTIASWASKAADFPSDVDEEWQRIIRSSFNQYKMFNTSLDTLKEIAEYCACNIEAGSIHFHSLVKVLRAGVKNHIDYLGSMEKVSDYTLLDLDSDSEMPASAKSFKQEDISLEGRQARSKHAAHIAEIIASAPMNAPVREDYKSSLEFIKAKSAYRIASKYREATKDSYI